MQKKPLTLALVAGLLALTAVLARKAEEPDRTTPMQNAAFTQSRAAAQVPIAPTLEPATPRFDVATVTLPFAPPESRSATAGLLSVQASLAAGKVLAGGDGVCSLSIELSAARPELAEDQPTPPTDFVVVLDVSGSMAGDKIATARSSVLSLIERLDPADRLALVTFERAARTRIELSPATPARAQAWQRKVAEISAGGGTNIEDGLRRGLAALRQAQTRGRVGRLLLLSDGLATAGLTRPADLAELASQALQLECAVTTLGLGQGFSETTMTEIAEAGSGNSYYLPDASQLAEILESELRGARRTVCRATAVQLALAPGVELMDAGGYPVRRNGSLATFNPGDMLPGTRTVHLTLKVPVAEPAIGMRLGRLQASFQDASGSHVATINQLPTVDCSASPEEVITSIDRVVWEAAVAQEGFGKLQERSARLVAGGATDSAQREVDQWISDHESLNRHIGSTLVAEHLSEAHQLSHRILAARTPQARNVFSKEETYSGKGKRHSSSWLSWD